MRRFLLMLTLLLGLCANGANPFKSPPQVCGDSLRFSLVTCSPGPEVYALFGHTAIRCEDLQTGEDVVFNYGMFSFNTPNFVMRFVKGETDYQLGVIPYVYFEEEYSSRGSYVEQQDLNLTPDERLQLYWRLWQNYQPRYRTYRYNYFYDNCTTRARDQIEACVEGKVVYPTWERERTFREIVHEYTAGHAWAEFGIDMLLGSEADRLIPERLQMFAPFYMLRAAREAVVCTVDGKERPLVSEQKRIVEPDSVEAETEFPLSPLQVAWLLVVLVIGVGMWELKSGKCFWGMDVLLFGLQGLAGCIIAFLFFFSTHPTVGSNYLLILFNPIPLLYLPVMVYRSIKRKKEYYHGVNTVVLTLFMAFWGIIPQEFNFVVVPLATSLWLRSLTHILSTCRRIK